jgi:hypothetical protein
MLSPTLFDSLCYSNRALAGQANVRDTCLYATGFVDDVVAVASSSSFCLCHVCIIVSFCQTVNRARTRSVAKRTQVARRVVDGIAEPCYNNDMFEHSGDGRRGWAFGSAVDKRCISCG